jgi:hypothetical protein
VDEKRILADQTSSVAGSETTQAERSGSVQADRPIANPKAMRRIEINVFITGSLSAPAHGRPHVI